MLKSTNTLSAHVIAQYFISKAREDNTELTPLKLQKILYYTQGWHLATHKAPLFSEKIYAWKYGPVVQEIYNSYKEYGSSNLAKVHVISKPISLCEKTNSIKHLDRIWNTYKDCSAEQLVTMTHNSEPWLTAYREPFSDIISTKSMTKHFSRLIASS